MIQAMTFNLRVRGISPFGERSWRKRLPRTVEIIRRHRPDVICTQEGLTGMLQELCARLPEYARVGEGRYGGARGEHNAILYRQDRFKRITGGQFWLSDQPDQAGSRSWDAGFPRICTWVVLQPRNPDDEGLRPFRLYNTHLDHRGQEARIRGAQIIWRYIRKHGEKFQLPLLLAGDFNAAPNSEPIRFLRGELELAGERPSLHDAYSLLPEPGAGATFHGYQDIPRKTQPIDYLFSGSGLLPEEVQVLRTKLRGGYPSDHYPVLGSFRFD